MPPRIPIIRCELKSCPGIGHDVRAGVIKSVSGIWANHPFEKEVLPVSGFMID